MEKSDQRIAAHTIEVIFRSRIDLQEREHKSKYCEIGEGKGETNMAGGRKKAEVCPKCNLTVKASDSIACGSVCGKKIHMTCARLTKGNVALIEENENVTFTCDSCKKCDMNAIAMKLDAVIRIMRDMNDKLITVEGRNTEMWEQMCEMKENKTMGSQDVMHAKEKQVLYADAVKDTKRKIVVKPKQDQEVNMTMNDIQSNVDSAKIPFSAIEKMKGGAVIIHCNDKNGSDELTSAIGHKLGEKYSTEEMAPKRPKIRITGVDSSIDQSLIGEQLMKQSDCLADGDLKILKITADRTNANRLTIITELNQVSFMETMKVKKVNIQWERCNVVEHYSVLRCYKCWGFGHMKKECKNDIACGKCGGSHETVTCRVNDMKCINCTMAKEKFNVDLETNHHAWSKKCQILERKFAVAKKRSDSKYE